jgi:hypothetical protein
VKSDLVDVDDIIARLPHAKPRRYLPVKKTETKVSDFIGIIEGDDVIDSTKEHDII